MICKKALKNFSNLLAENNMGSNNKKEDRLFDKSKYTPIGRGATEKKKLELINKIQKSFEGVDEPDGPEYTDEEFIKEINNSLNN